MTHRFRVRIGTQTVAGTEGPDFISTEAQALHYAMQYREEGEVTVQRQHQDSTGKTYWKRHALFAHLPKDTDQ